MLGFEPLSNTAWPEYDELIVIEEKITIAVQINGKTRGTIDIEIDTKEKLIFDMILNDEKLNKFIIGMEIIKKIYVPNRLINILIS
jgi:leucyl-tRNA synthetase